VVGKAASRPLTRGKRHQNARSGDPRSFCQAGLIPRAGATPPRGLRSPAPPTCSRDSAAGLHGLHVTCGAPVSTARSVARLTRVLMDNTLWLYLLLRRSELWRFRDCRPRSIHRAECWPGTDANRLFRAHDGNGWTLAAGRRSEHSSSLKKEALGRNVAGARPLERASCSISR
jgi:hypothetical protein